MTDNILKFMYIMDDNRPYNGYLNYFMIEKFYKLINRLSGEEDNRDNVPFMMANNLVFQRGRLVCRFKIMLECFYLWRLRW